MMTKSELDEFEECVRRSVNDAYLDGYDACRFNESGDGDLVVSAVTRRIMTDLYIRLVGTDAPSL
jgi:hypothetical protein